MRNLVLIFAILLTTFSVQAQMSVIITGSSSGAPLAATIAATSDFNGFDVSCASGTGAAGNINNNGVVTITGINGAATHTYALSGGTQGSGSSSNIFTGLTAGTYTGTVTDAGCPAINLSITVTAPSALTAALTKVDDLCQSNSGSVLVAPSGGVGSGGYDITWTSAGAGSPAGTPATHIANAASQSYTGLSGNATYVFSIVDINGCTAQ
jgi:hypothetical protein